MRFLLAFFFKDVFKLGASVGLIQLGWDGTNFVTSFPWDASLEARWVDKTQNIARQWRGWCCDIVIVKSPHRRWVLRNDAKIARNCSKPGTHFQATKAMHAENVRKGVGMLLLLSSGWGCDLNRCCALPVNIRFSLRMSASWCNG